IYAALGKAARDWPSFHRIVAALKTLPDDRTLLVQSGKPIAVFPTHSDAPRVLMANSNLGTLGDARTLLCAREEGTHLLGRPDGWILAIHWFSGRIAGNLRDLRRGGAKPLSYGRSTRPLDSNFRAGRDVGGTATRRDYARWSC